MLPTPGPYSLSAGGLVLRNASCLLLLVHSSRVIVTAAPSQKRLSDRSKERRSAFRDQRVLFGTEFTGGACCGSARASNPRRQGTDAATATSTRCRLVCLLLLLVVFRLHGDLHYYRRHDGRKEVHADQDANMRTNMGLKKRKKGKKRREKATKQTTQKSLAHRNTNPLPALLHIHLSLPHLSPPAPRRYYRLLRNKICRPTDDLLTWYVLLRTDYIIPIPPLFLSHLFPLRFCHSLPVPITVYLITPASLVAMPPVRHY